MFKSLILLLGIFVAGSISFADEIVCENGEHIIGKLGQAKDDKISFTSDTLGKLTIDVNKIKHIITEKPFDLHLESGDIVKNTNLKKQMEHIYYIT